MKVVMSYRDSLPRRYFPLFPPPSAVRRHVPRADQARALGSGTCCADDAETTSELGPHVATARDGESGEGGGRHSRASEIVCTEST